MQITLELTETESKLIHTFIRRSIFEDYIRPMQESGDTKEQTTDRVYNTISAMEKIRTAIENN
jgi:hypothetical protein